MPGIFGYCINKTLPRYQIDAMSKTLLATNKLTNLPSYQDNFVEVSQVSLECLDYKQTTQNDIVLYLEGCAYNLKDIKSKFNLISANFAELLIEAYLKKNLEQVLNKINGYFAAVLYDKTKKKLFLISDRFGLRFIYYYLKDGNFAFAPEVKTILSLNTIDKTIDKNAFDCFIQQGQLLNDITWFKNIKLIKPASILEFDISSKTLLQKNYWKFSEIKEQKIKFSDAIDKFGELFINAVRIRLDKSKRVSVPISGGRDSRMIVSSINKLDPNFKTFNYTIGNKDSGDIIIAKQVCDVAKQKQYEYNIPYNNFMFNRINAVFALDGSYDINNMHAPFLHESIGEKADYLFSGVVANWLGGEIYKMYPQYKNMRINKEIAKMIYQEQVDLVDYTDDYYNNNHFDVFYLNNTIRRFGLPSISSTNKFYETLLPFCDNNLVEFIFSIPDEYRELGLYSKTLLKTFPEFYSDIPWQRTGQIVGWELNPVFNERSIANSKVREYFFDYAAAIREREAAYFLRRLLKRNTSQYQQYTDQDFYKEYLVPHLNNRADFTQKISYAATIEIYLRQIANIPIESDYENPV